MPGPKILLVALLIGVPGRLTLADELEVWATRVSTEFAKQQYRSGTDRAIVAISCSRSSDRELNDACERLRWKLADAMSTRRLDVIEPRADFDLVRTWDHVDCHQGDLSYLGWATLNLVVRQAEPQRRRRSRLAITVDVPDGSRRETVEESTLDATSVRALPLTRASGGGSPFVISRVVPQEAAVASHLAEAMICQLKDLPEKYLLDNVHVEGDLDSPALAEWSRRVGERLVAHLNRVLQSGWVREGSATLEIHVDAVDDGRFRLLPGVRRADEPPGSGGLVLHGEQTCPDLDCQVQVAGFLSALIGDLRVFGNELPALESHLKRRGLTLRLDRVASEEPIGTIVGQTPDPGTLVSRIPYGEVVVQLSAGPLVELRGGPSPKVETTPRTSPQQTPPSTPRPRAPSPQVTAPPRIYTETRVQTVSSIRPAVEAIGRQLRISTRAIERCLAALDRPGADREAFEKLVNFYDPRVPDKTFLRDVWSHWYEFGHPQHDPYFHESSFNLFVREVADVMFRRMQGSVYATEAR